MAVLQKYLRDNYDGRPGKAYEWLLCPNSLETGPLFFENPAPFCQAAAKGEPGFVAPSGRLKSPLLLDVVQAMLHGTHGSMKDPSLIPCGLFLMAMGALERAATCLKPNTTTDALLLTNFCHAKWGGAIADCCHGFSTISSEKWAKILSLCQDSLQARGFVAATASEEARVIQRTNIFSFSSPTK
ncbi:hypothetical protein EST38_g8628 [Candolleomyces aberdarensis]|uniref:Uncharacterized protein n=1 Tax=Candolleomyces aberdarensis TaxID=2316362 RepID=A0A4Q2DEC1_9AGAR|nr:hypothetical protein EST38_g8628 [Candolleomyces aberdarensis]